MHHANRSLPSSPSLLRHPNDVNTTVQMQRAVVNLNEAFLPSNTSRAHQPKVAEFFQFCDEIYPMEHYKYHLTFEKVYRFLYFQAFRPLKARGGKRKYPPCGTPEKRTKLHRSAVVGDNQNSFEEGHEASKLKEPPVIFFDRIMYDEVMAQFQGDPSPPASATPTPFPLQPLKPISWSTFDQYKQVLKKIHREEQLQGASSLVWERYGRVHLMIWQSRLKGGCPM
jgi:hypothetical protein